MKKTHVTYSFVFSLGLHILVLSLLLGAWVHAKSFKVKGKTHPIPVYLVHNAKLAPKKIASHPHLKLQPSSQKGLVQASMMQNKQAAAHEAIKKVHRPQAKKVQGDDLNHLVTLIYQAIAAHKVYPETAADQGQGGRVVVGFTLAPSGNISQIHITQSSDVQALNAAAIATVRAASPIKGVTQYLTASEQLAVPIVYHDEG